MHRAIHSPESALRCLLLKHQGRKLIPLFSDGIFLAVPVDSPFAERAEVNLTDLSESTFIT